MSCWTLTSFFLSEEPVLWTKLKRDFFLGGADCVLPTPEEDSVDEKLLDADNVGSRFFTTSRRSLSLSNVDMTRILSSGEFGTNIELLDSLWDFILRSMLHTFDVILLTIFFG